MKTICISLLISGLDMQKSCAISDDKAYKKLRNLGSDNKSSKALAKESLMLDCRKTQNSASLYR
jgi:hypothetical protein